LSQPQEHQLTKELADMTTTTRKSASIDTTTLPVVHPEKHALPSAAGYALGVMRIAFGFYFLWAFVDKLFGLGFATPAERAVVNGGSPTTGYLSGVEGPFAGLFNAMAGNAVIDVLFMAGLLGIGLTLVLGAGARVGALAGVAMYAFMYLASLPTVTNPVLDDHLTGIAVMLVIATVPASWSYLGLGSWWARIAPKWLR
jgi:thiosulfate dehydrogenase (quinone) large subunit